MKEITKNMAFWNYNKDQWENINSILGKNVKLYKDKNYYIIEEGNKRNIFKKLRYKDLLKLKGNKNE